ncbi:DUF1194 domain-containing protein [Rhodobacteraceae bacterium CCMM004]|nr:DUF1194 domain-containing protein [Rhodobacteraceae bacterium CCMM004]
MRRLARLLALCLWPWAALAQPVEVDVELILMVDVSRSMSPRDLEIQRRGYAEALMSPAVIDAIRGGLLGRVAVAYVEWAGTGSQRVIVDWRLLQGEEDARDFARVLVSQFATGMRRTSISGALDYAADSIASNAYEGLRKVVDVSGDGPNNQGGRVDRARDRALAQGLVINGLPLMTRDMIGRGWHLEDLDLYYLDCVIGGPGAFVIPVVDWSEFAEAVRRKLILEIVGLPAPEPRPRRAQTRAPYDCLVGEKMWERNRRYWELP